MITTRQLCRFVTLILCSATVGTLRAQWLDTTVAVGGEPTALCYNSTNNKVYCANAGTNDITVIDGATNHVVATVRTGSGPRDLCYNPVDNKIYSANEGDSTVTVIDGAGDSVIATAKANTMAPR